VRHVGVCPDEDALELRLAPEGAEFMQLEEVVVAIVGRFSTREKWHQKVWRANGDGQDGCTQVVAYKGGVDRLEYGEDLAKRYF
jgi:hypothetical protein